MATNNQRREAAKRQLEQQLAQRQRQQSHKRGQVLIISIAASVVVVIVAVALIAILNRGSDKKTVASSASSTSAAAATDSSAAGSAAATSAAAAPPTATYGGVATADPVTYQGVTVSGGKDLTKASTVTSAGTGDPAQLEAEDLVVGTGAAAGPDATVTVQYQGVLYKDGTAFDSSWSRGQTAQFSLDQVVTGFKYGIGGATGLDPMKVGGRRLMILPSSMGYGAQAQSSIPANSPLVFIVDLTAVS